MHLDCKAQLEILLDRTNNYFEPLTFLADQRNNYALCYGQSMKAHDCEQFKEAMKKEANDLDNKNIFELMPLSEKRNTKINVIHLDFQKKKITRRRAFEAQI